MGSNTAITVLTRIISRSPRFVQVNMLIEDSGSTWIRIIFFFSEDGSASGSHQSGKLDPDPDQSGKLDPDPHQSERQDPDLHQSVKGHFGALDRTNLGKGEW
jgi:hypothetical protein